MNRKLVLSVSSILSLTISIASASYFGLSTRPFDLIGIRFCPQTANTISRKHFKTQEDAQDKLDRTYCRQEEIVLKDTWDRLQSTTSKPLGSELLMRDIPASESNAGWFLIAPAAMAVAYACRKIKEYGVAENNHKELEKFKLNVVLNRTSRQHELQFKKTVIENEWDDRAVAYGHVSVDAREDIFKKHRQLLELQQLAAVRQYEQGISEADKKIAENYRDAKQAQNDMNGNKKETKTQSDAKGKSIVDIVKDLCGADLKYIGAYEAPSIMRHRFQIIKSTGGKSTKFNDIEKLAEDIALNLGEEFTPRIVREKNEIVIELPRTDRQFPSIFDTLPSIKKPNKPTVLMLGGIDTNGETMLIDVLDSPDCHGLGAGATKSGKTQGLYAQIASLVHLYSPKELQLAIYDGKNALILPNELKPWLFNGKVSNAGQGKEFIDSIEVERVRRLKLRAGYRDITEYNNDNDTVPYIVVLMDEYSVDREYFEGNPNDTDSNIMKQLGKLSRSEGIHLFAYDQSAKSENISNRVKENLALRFVYKMTDAKSSSYLEVDGADKLLGRGDLIVKWENRQYRCQMPNCSPDDLKKIVSDRYNYLELDTSPTNNVSNDQRQLLIDLRTWYKSNTAATHDDILQQFSQFSGHDIAHIEEYRESIISLVTMTDEDFNKTMC